MADKNYFLVSATYGGKSCVAPISKTDSSGTICNTIKVTYGSTSKYFGATTETLSCANKYMTGDIEISLGSTSALAQIELGCKGQAMSTDVVINIREISGSNYDIITETQYWTVPAGVTAINVCCVGGGGGGGASKEITISGTSPGSSGGGGGYVTTGSFSNLTSGEQFLCSIGKGGAGGTCWYDNSTYANGNGSTGETTTIQRVNTPSQSVSAAGGSGAGRSSYSTQYAGSGGTGGGLGSNNRVTIESTSDYIYMQCGAAGGTELVRSYSGNNVYCPENNKYGYSSYTKTRWNDGSDNYFAKFSGTAGAGQSATTLFNNVYYGHGGGGGSVGDNASRSKDWWIDGGPAFAGGGYGCGMPCNGAASGGDGTANTGGGGGGGGGSASSTSAGHGGAGGSGVIIITW